jgi:hypothetical protein
VSEGSLVVKEMVAEEVVNPEANMAEMIGAWVSGATLLTVTITEAEVAWFPALSRAVAVKV